MDSADVPKLIKMKNRIFPSVPLLPRNAFPHNLIQGLIATFYHTFPISSTFKTGQCKINKTRDYRLWSICREISQVYVWILLNRYTTSNDVVNQLCVNQTIEVTMMQVTYLAISRIAICCWPRYIIASYFSLFFSEPVPARLLLLPLLLLYFFFFSVVNCAAILHMLRGKFSHIIICLLVSNCRCLDATFRNHIHIINRIRVAGVWWNRILIELFNAISFSFFR